MNPTGGIAPESPSAFPWDEAMALGLNALRWSPRDFWAATPRELIAAAGRGGRRDAASAADLRRLMEAYPDP
ncbi:phage tail assembly chaperone [Methylobacterium sp. W2]|uniref:phage tail assembly chaperone n=1 Tax=Methylobacterium sp. W2 TaxID=2598107 RepID=UPI001D0BFB82|nr:phage tail assembly chaperone [Methylobacterium sp. W2]MCC0809138.1 phage tail assembly chaperone [Methylobacterium sp. W2]